MNRYCEDCRHWTRNPPVPFYGIATDLDPLEPWGECSRPQRDDAKMAPINDDGEVGTLQTQRDFSCNQWQSK